MHLRCCPSLSLGQFHFVDCFLVVEADGVNGCRLHFLIMEVVPFTGLAGACNCCHSKADSCLQFEKQGSNMGTRFAKSEYIEKEKEKKNAAISESIS